MPFYGDRAYDNGLSVFDIEASNIEICSAEPTTYTAATSTSNLGTKAFGAGAVAAAPVAGVPNGRQIATAAVTDGTTGTSGTASHWAITDRVNARLLAAGPLSASQAVTAGNPWTLPSFTIRIPAPV